MTIRVSGHGFSVRGPDASRPSTLAPTGLLGWVRDATPHVMVLDREATDRDVFQVVQAVREISPGTRVALLFASFDGLEICRACRAGICDCLPKTEDINSLRCAFKRVLANAAVRSAGAHKRPSPVGRSYGAKMDRAACLRLLTKRESEMLPYIARGFSLEGTAEIMCLSPKTVGVHKMHIMAKLGIHDRVSLARFAIREGLIPVWDD